MYIYTHFSVFFIFPKINIHFYLINLNISKLFCTYQMLHNKTKIEDMSIENKTIFSPFSGLSELLAH